MNPQQKQTKSKDKEIKDDIITEIIKKSEELSQDWLERDIKKPDKKCDDDKKENRLYTLFS